MEGGRHEGVASSKKNEFKTRVQISVPCSLKEWRKNGYNQDTLFVTKTAEKPYPLGPHIPI